MLCNQRFFCNQLGVVMRIEQTHWQCIRDWLKAEIGNDSFNNWLAPLNVDFDASTDQTVVIHVPTRFMYDWVLRHYSTLIERGIHNALESTPHIDYIVKVAAQAAPQKPQQEATKVTVAPKLQTPSVEMKVSPQPKVSVKTGGQSYEGNPLDPRFTFDNFVVGKSNEFAYAAAKRIAESEDLAYNPFILHGGVGLGKTHLMHAIAWYVRVMHPERKVLYISAEKFLNSFVSAMRNKTTSDFKEIYRNVDVLMVDDVQFIAGKGATQEEFFHTFEALVSERKQIILTADKPPHEMQGIEDRLRSRLGWGLATEIHRPDLETRMAILDQKATQLGIELNRGVAQLLASKIDSNIRELEGALNRLAAHATLVQTDITIESATELLKDLFRHMSREVTIPEIQKRVCEYYNIKVADMASSRRTRAVARPRQIAMYLSKQLTSKSFPEIGREFGGRDHTTVIHAAKTIEKMVDDDAVLAEDVTLLSNMLRGI